MLDEIYLRLLMELTPDEHKPNRLDAERIICGYGRTQESKDAYGKLLRTIYEADSASDIGMHYGRLLQPYALCDFSRALMTAPTFRDSLQLINELHYMQGAAYHLTMYQTAGTLSVALTYPYKKNVSDSQRRFCSEAVFTYLLNLARACVDSDAVPTRIWLDFEEPAYSGDYLEEYSCEPDFKAPIALLEFSSELGSRELNTSNHTLYKTYIKKCQDAARAAERYWSYDYRTSTLLMRHMPEAFSGEKLSTLLNISPRGLQKKLSNLDTSFSGLSSLARIEQTKVLLLQQQKTIDATAELLGFQTTSGFRRFFKSEFGLSVNTFLNQVEQLAKNPEKIPSPRKQLQTS